MNNAIRNAAIILMVAAFGFACGVKAPPLPTSVLLPDRPGEPVYSFGKNGVITVSFKPPEKNIKGLPLKDLGGFFIEKSENRIRPGFCPGCPVEYTDTFSIEAEKPPARKFVADVLYRFEDKLTPGYFYKYRIHAHDSDGDHDPASFTTLQVYYDDPGLPPDAVTARTEDKMVFLEWAPPQTLVDGRPMDDLAGYDIYRREPGGPWVKLNSDNPWTKNFFEDSRVANEKTYEYEIRSVRDIEETMVPGPPSPIVSARPRDLTPPPPPVNVYSAAFKDGVKLTWPAAKAPDLAGYRIYKRREGQTESKRIGPALLKVNLFLDSDVRIGETYYYRVTSVDGSPAANESEPSVEVSIIYEP